MNVHMSHKPKTPKDVLDYAKKHEAKQLDLRFTDLPGLQQHVSYPVSQLDEAAFEEGFGIDGSSIRGWAAINESDMLLIPDPDTAFHRSVLRNENAGDDRRRHRSDHAPALRSRSALDRQESRDVSEEFRVWPTRLTSAPKPSSSSSITCVSIRPRIPASISSTPKRAAGTPSRAENNLGYRPRYKEGYFPVPPTDHYQDLRAEMVQTMIKCGLDIECHHHEVATGGQCEIDQRFDTLVSSADNMMLYKYVVRNAAYQYGKAVTFMPKPLFGDNGSGMHTHQSLWKDGKPLFAGDMYAGLSQMALWYIGGLLKHARALSAIIAPTTNSYKRLVPGYEAPVNLAYSRRNRSAAVRIPMYSASPKAKRVEFRPPDPSSNPYLAFAAMMMAGLDGVINKIDPGESLDKDIYDLSPEEMKIRSFDAGLA